MPRLPRSTRLSPPFAVIPVILLAGIAGGCGASGRTNATFYDPTGQTVATGRLDLPRLETAGPAFQGQWTLATVRDEQLRQAFATGPYRGGRRGDEFFITLNPARVDDKIDLTGRVSGGTLTGWWGHSTFPGLEQSGTFDAKPAKPR